MHQSRAATPRSVLIGTASIVAFVALMALAGLGSRWGWWEFRAGFRLLRWGAYGALTATLITIVVALVAYRGGSRSGLAIAATLSLVALGAVFVPWQWRRTARDVPPIHDITTDMERPPAFVELLVHRRGARNKPEYGGPEVAAKQKLGYPDIRPVSLDVSPDSAFARSLATARAMGWSIVAADSASGRIEATDRTFWFGFYDDVVIRVEPAVGGSRVDVRSVSRVGGSDVGTNARRIRSYVRKLRKS